jgi:ABC-type multidrug transport system fused ATPase/permease subunit
MGSGKGKKSKESALILGGSLVLQVLRVIAYAVLWNIYIVWPLFIGFDNGYGRAVWVYPSLGILWLITAFIPLLMVFSKRARNTLMWTPKRLEKAIMKENYTTLYDLRTLSDQIATMLYDVFVSIILLIGGWFIWDYITSKPGYPGRFNNYWPNKLIGLETLDPVNFPAGTIGSNSIGDIISFLAYLLITLVHCMIIGNDTLKTAAAAFFAHPMETRGMIPEKMTGIFDNDDVEEI